MSIIFASFLAQATTTAAGAATTNGAPVDPNASSGGGGYMFLMYPVLLALLYFAFFRPQSQAKKKQEELVKAAKTGDRVVTTGGIHGVITNVKDSTVIVKVADNVKLEIEKANLDKIIRAEATDEKIVVSKS